MSSIAMQPAICERPFCLGEPFYSEWDCCSLSMFDDEAGPSPQRFAEPTSQSEMAMICKGFVSP